MPRIAAISIYVIDMEKAIAFYRDVLGFTVAARPVPYIAELEHEGTALLLCQAEASVPVNYPASTATIVGIATTDLAGRVKEFEKRKVDMVVKEPQEFPGGTFIAVRDPSGNVVELLQFNG